MTYEQQSFEFDKRPTIKGFPELRWTGKRPYESTVYYPAQLKERHGHTHVGGGDTTGGSIRSTGEITSK